MSGPARPTGLDGQRTRALRRRLLAWFRRKKRDLPWRRTNDPYRIWVAEVMLQQTQVATVLPYYRRFLRAFPSLRALAKAAEGRVLKAWQGLGYYRRALHLHEAARQVVREYGGRVPDDPEAFARLPGVGRYTCGAVQSIAFGRPLAALDANAARVIARWLAIEEPIDAAATRRTLWDAAEAFVSRRAPGNWNQAVMELGARVCTPRRPRCADCPVRTLCEAYERGLVENIPVHRARRKVPHIEVGVGIVWRRGRVLLCKRPRDRMLGGLWEFPGGKRQPDEPIRDCIRRELQEECAIDVRVGDHLVDVDHAYSHLRVTLRCYHARLERGPARAIGCDRLAWVKPERIADYPLPAADVRILEALGVDPEAARRSARYTEPPDG